MSVPHAPNPPCFTLLGVRIHADECDCPEERIRSALGRERPEGHALRIAAEAGMVWYDEPPERDVYAQVLARVEVAASKRRTIEIVWPDEAPDADALERAYPQAWSVATVDARAPELMRTGFYFAGDLSIGDAERLIGALERR